MTTDNETQALPPRTELFKFRVTEQEKDRYDAAAHSERKTMSEWARDVLNNIAFNGEAA